MFIDPTLANQSARFGGAERDEIGTRHVEFRPSEPRRRFSGTRAINMSPLRGEALQRLRHILEANSYCSREGFHSGGVKCL